MALNDVIVYDAAQAVMDARSRKDIVAQLMRDDILRPNIDFGIVPGSAKPTLLKPGAERLCAAFRLDPVFETISVTEDWNRPLFFYRILCRLQHVDTRSEVATGIGSCNSMEAKYRWREQKRLCPVCGKDTIIKGKAEYGGGWLCFTKKGGCGAKFDEKDNAIIGQAVGQVENDDIYSIVNTIDKMAQKRALIAATLIGANASEFFTQDLEDMPGFGVRYGDAIEGTYEEVRNTAQNGAGYDINAVWEAVKDSGFNDRKHVENTLHLLNVPTDTTHEQTVSLLKVYRQNNPKKGRWYEDGDYMTDFSKLLVADYGVTLTQVMRDSGRQLKDFASGDAVIEYVKQNVRQ